ncbi:MAG: hypothetical protein L6R41_004994 [Letrouitia leprolyta]|nr:MAG: hypothetical protein L6R41_004994 [Letrouitia leprolyta]
MSALHHALQSLGPADFSSVPTEESETKDYIQQLFAHAQIIIDSVPPPVETPSLPARSRANTFTSNPSCASDLLASQARSELIDPTNTPLQKEWSKPIKLGAKENPLGISVYKLGGKDGRGAWFARRSVHEGMGFRKWKLGLQREFPETMEVQGGPGEGNIRGIGGERRVEKIAIDGVGNIEGVLSTFSFHLTSHTTSLYVKVYHLSAQFPGPTTPRDFVTMLVTSSAAIDAPDPSQTDVMGTKEARHFMVISKPCTHPECPPREGFIRGQYESVEFIREIPVKLTRSASTTNLLQMRRQSITESRDPTAQEADLVQSAQQTLDKDGSGDEMLADMDVGSHAPLAKEVLVQEGRKRGKTISFAESRGIRAKGETMDTPHKESSDPAEQNPVEWVMITRSDPGGSVPRFLVERGTPSGIFSDASKFLDWACKKKHPVEDDYGEKASEVDQEIARKNSHAEALEQYQTNGHLAGLDVVLESAESSMTLTDKNFAKDRSLPPEPGLQESYMSTLANATVAGFEAYAPQSVLDRVHGHQFETIDPFTVHDNAAPATLNTSEDIDAEAMPRASTSDSFATAEDYLDDANSTSSKSMTPDAKPSPAQERELAKFQQRKKTLDEKLAQTKEKEGKDTELLTSKEEDRIRKAEEKHAREVAKQEQRYQKEVAKIEMKRVKEELKAEERKRKAEEKDEKVKLTRERDAARAEVENLKRERELLKEQVGALQRENTALVAKVGKLEVGKKVLGEVQAEIESASGGRSRSSSIRRKRGGSTVDGGLEATVLAGGKAA